MPHKDLVTWTALISGYSQHDRPQDALVLFPEMLRHGLEPNQFTLSSLLKASGAVSDDNHGRQLHTYCFKYGLDSNVYVGTALVDMYARCGHMDESQLGFDALDTKNEVSWNALIAGHARKAQGEHALRLFWKKQGATPYRIFNLGNTSPVGKPYTSHRLNLHQLLHTQRPHPPSLASQLPTTSKTAVKRLAGREALPHLRARPVLFSPSRHPNLYKKKNNNKIYGGTLHHD
ncbi:hypothetical protein ACFX2B_040859 [Malus domestica]